MKNIYVAICFVFAVVTSVSAQWQPLKGFKGGNIRVRASGQVIIASTAGSTYFYSGDAGASWHLRQINGIPTPGIWNGNIIQCDSMGNLLIDYNCSNNLVFVSSYFKDNNRVVAGFAVGANNRIFANAVNTSLGIRELYYSDDTCRTWTLTPVNGAPVASGNFIYAFNGAERYSSVDNGVTWDSAAATNLLLGQSAHGSVIAYGQNVGIGINYSTDAGQTWHFKGVGGTNASSLTVGDSAIYFSGSGPWGGLYKIDYVSGNVVLVDSNSFSDPSIQSLSYANGKIWMGTTGDGLYAYDEHTKVVSKPVNDVYARNVDQCYFNHNQILATQRWYTNYGGEERYELMYSNDYGASFNSKKIKYVNINVPAVVDTQIYYLSRNDTGYTNQFYTLLGSTEDDLCGLAHLFSNPQKIFNIDSIFMVVCGSSISDGYLFRSPDLGLHWDSIHYFPLGIYDARQWQDSVFVSSGSRVYAFDKAGNLAYSMFLNIGSSGSGSIPPLWVTDTTFIASNRTQISSVHKGNGDFRILATPATFGGYQIKSSGWYNGYLFASVDTLGIFVLKPGQTTWAPFNEGLYPYTFSDFYFDDSLIYGRIDALKWLWSRSVLDLTPVVTLENPEQNTPEVFVNVYPNPAHNSITVVKSVDGNSTFRLFDAVGNKYLEKQGHEAIITLDVSGLSAGLYFVEISSDKFKITKKVVIAR